MNSALHEQVSPYAGGVDAWGPLATPIHRDAAGPGDPTWKDNAYLALWDVAEDIYGSVHVSTSPNDSGSRRARFSLVVAGTAVEIIEELPPGSFGSESISFQLDGTVVVHHHSVSAVLGNGPLWTPADFGLGDLIPPLVPGKPLQHFQQACTVRGTVAIADGQYELNGTGMRDRTWGFRDEAAQWVEYAGLVCVIDGTFVSAMKFVGADATLRSEGYRINADGAVLVTDIGFRRNAAAQFLSATLTLADGHTEVISMTERLGGFFVPMGRAETTGPAFGTYDDFMTLVRDDREGAGFVEQGILHRAC